MKEREVKEMRKKSIIQTAVLSGIVFLILWYLEIFETNILIVISVLYIIYLFIFYKNYRRTAPFHKKLRKKIYGK